MDRYSRYTDVAFPPRMTSFTVTGKLKNIFAQHGVPETIVADNGSQFSPEFRSFSKQWNFQHIAIVLTTLDLMVPQREQSRLWRRSRNRMIFS